jgi:hypothetical protein
VNTVREFDSRAAGCAMRNGAAQPCSGVSVGYLRRSNSGNRAKLTAMCRASSRVSMPPLRRRAALPKIGQLCDVDGDASRFVLRQ